jgi:TolB-like protein
MGAIFLSYARENRDWAEKLAHVLEAAGHDVWWDRHLDGGEEFSAEIEAALDKSDVVVVAWSQESVKSRWVRDEANVGCESGTLVPVSIDGSLPPMGFRQFHTLDLAGWKAAKRDERTSELLRSVDRRLRGKEEIEPAAPKTKPQRRIALPKGKLVWAAVLLLLVAVGGVLIFQKLNTPDEPLKPTIALLPFTTTSPDPELRQVASQVRDSIAHTFSQSGTPLRLLSGLPKDGRPAVDFLIAGDVSRNGDKLLVTVRLDEAAHGVTVYSHRFEADRDEAKDLPERIGAQMAGNLSTNSTMKLLDRRRPLAPELLTDLMSDDFTSGSPLQAYQNSKRVAAKAPDFPYTQVSVAYTTAFALVELPREERAEAVAEARRAAELSIKLGPQFGDAYSPWCILHSETLWAQCEDRLRAAKRIDPDAPYVNTFLSHLLRNVGRFEEASGLTRLAHTHDIYVPTKIAWMLKTLETEGDGAGAKDLYQQGARWWPEYKPMFFRNRLYALVGLGDFDAILQLEREAAVKDLYPDYKDSTALVAALKSRSVPAARKACPDTDGYFLNIRCMIALAKLGDQDGAYAIAAKLYPRRVGRTPAETEQIWLDDPEGVGQTEYINSPAAAPMRRDPRYLQVVERVGLLAYWRSGREPDFCRKDPEPICKQLMRRN